MGGSPVGAVTLLRLTWVTPSVVGRGLGGPGVVPVKGEEGHEGEHGGALVLGGLGIPLPHCLGVGK